jgi:hypothetical protein
MDADSPGLACRARAGGRWLIMPLAPGNANDFDYCVAE